ncbi:MAG: hypothetical protein ACYSU1_02775 [Planctomycetota bacterium]|jgi:hypothetical protein
MIPLREEYRVAPKGIRAGLCQGRARIPLDQDDSLISNPAAIFPFDLTANAIAGVRFLPLAQILPPLQVGCLWSFPHGGILRLSMARWN